MSIQSLGKYFEVKEIVPENAKVYSYEEICSAFGCGDKTFREKMGMAIESKEWKIVYKKSNMKRRFYMPVK